MLIVDQFTLMVMNLNWTEAAFSENRELAVVTDDPARVTQALAIFENDWAGQSETPIGPLVISPETSRNDLLQFIASAEATLDVYAEVMTDQEILDALVEAQLRGVRVRLVMSEAAGESLWHEEPGFLARSGIEVIIVNQPYIHAKALIVDGTAAWIGSQNFTANSLDNNREIGTFVNDAPSLARIVRAFEADVAAGMPLGAPE
jgi:phosphatidylserine/phosphatidylglycerophosphate/cardiolipin synthase-like enzyme